MDKRKRILVVDDESSNRELLEVLLNNLGHDVDMASDGVEALEMLDRRHDLVLLDVMMAGIDGFEVARRIRANLDVSDIPICMVTALSSKEERLRAVEAGANDFISKPIDKIELKVRTASLLQAKQSQDEVRHYQAQLEAQHGLLQEKHAQLRKLSELKDEFMQIASHDLRNPLSCIVGFASLIGVTALTMTPNSEDINDWVAKIRQHCRNMQKIIENFLDFQALEDGQFNLHPEIMNINELACEALERNGEYASQKLIEVRMDLEKGELMLNTDKSKLNQVLENLIGNAIKFSSQGKTLTLRTRKTDAGYLVEVMDSGPGIAEGDLSKLFVKYAKLGNLPTGDEKSSSLGLAICKKVVDALGGTIGARNNETGGATFWFELPNGPMAA